MSFNDKEISTQDGRAAALYKMVWGNTVWRYTSADEDIEYPEGSGDIYTAIAIWDDGMTQGGSSANDMTVHAPANIPIVPLYRSTPPALSITLEVRRLHKGEADAPIYWLGWVGNVKRSPGDAEVLIIGRSLLSTFKATGLRLCWTRGCPHFLYDGECRVDPEDFKVTAEIVAMTGNTVTLDAVDDKPAGWFDGGILRWIANEDDTIDQRGIEGSEDDTTLIIFGSTDRLEVGMTVDLFPGCDLTAETCDDKFDNLPNHGGHKYMAGSSPFDGTQVF